MTNTTELEYISVSDYQQLTRLETEMEADRAAFARFAENLAIIRDKRLYRAEYRSFDDYCTERWQLTRRHVDRLIASAEAVADLDPLGLISNERVARALGEIADPVARKAVWAAAVKAVGAEHVTAAIVKGAQTVLETAQATGGYVDTGDGEMTALSAAILQETTERAERQRQHIRDGRKPPLYNDVMSYHDVVDGELARRMMHLVKAGAVSKVRVVIYEVEQ